VLEVNFALCCGPGTDYPLIQIFQCKLERRDAITNEVLEPITFVLAYPTVCTQCKEGHFMKKMSADCYLHLYHRGKRGCNGD